MPINGMTLGSDLNLVVVDAAQGLQTFSKITMVDVKQRTKNIRSVGLDSDIRLAEIPDGWTIDIDIDVTNGALINYIMANEAAYYDGGSVGTVTGTTSVTWGDGSTGTYQFTGGAIKLNGGGSFKGQEKVTQKATIEFARGFAAT
jgi:hypothetical protein